MTANSITEIPRSRNTLAGAEDNAALVYMYDVMYRCGETAAHANFSPNVG